jgi:hypothetical protein
MIATGNNTSTTNTTAHGVAPHDNFSLPSTEKEGLRENEHVGGVGALPGSINETGVADVKLRDNDTTTGTSHTGTGLTGTSHTTDTVKDHTTTDKDYDHDKTRTGAALGAAAGALGVGSALGRDHDDDKTRTHTDASHTGTTGTTTGTDSTLGHADDKSTLKPASDGTFGSASLGDHNDRPHATRSHHGTSHTDIKHTGSTLGAGAAAVGAGSALSHDDNKSHNPITDSASQPRHDGDEPHEGTDKTYHPAALHPVDADYSGVDMQGADPTATSAGEKTKDEGTHGLGASAATAGEERDTSVAGLKDGSDRHVHGGVPGDIGGGTMPVGDDHEGGADKLDVKNKSGMHSLDTSSATASSNTGLHARDSTSATSATTDSVSPGGTHKPKFMDKVKGEMKILSGKISKNTEKVEEGHRLKTGNA